MLQSVKKVNKMSLLEKLQLRGDFTPDFSDVRLREEILLFVYDSLKRGTWEHKKYLEGALYLGKAATLHSDYTMKTNKDHPVVFKEKVMMHCSVRGEAYLVSPQHILAIDEMEQNGMYMNRTLDKIVLFDQVESEALQKSGNHYLKALWCLGFIYLGNKTTLETSKMTARLSRQDKTATNAVSGRPYYEWDTWEAEWPYIDE